MTLRRILKGVINGPLGAVGFRVVRLTPPRPTPPLPAGTETLARLERDVAALLKSGQPIKVHTGCGPRILKGWINLDLAYEPYQAYMQYYTDTHYPASIRGSEREFYAVDVSKTPLPFPDCSVDAIWHEDFFEHLSQKAQVLFLAEAWRVLKKNGVHRVNTPNLITSLRDKHDFRCGYRGVYQGAWDNWAHISILTPRALEDLATWIGYSRIEFNGKNLSISKLIPIEYRPDPRDTPESASFFADLIK